MLRERKGDNSGSGSFQRVLGEVGVVQGSKTPVDPALGQLVTPPGLPGLPGPAVPAAVAPAPVVSVGESLNENLRNLELPKLPPDSTSVDFGDWLAFVGPCGTSSQWVTSTPLQRLRLKVVSPTELAKWPRTEQRAVTMLLAAVPDPIRRELISSTKLQSVEILYALLCRFQPGGVHEKTSLLKASWRTDWVPMRTSTSSCRPCGCGDGNWEDQLSWGHSTSGATHLGSRSWTV